MVTTFVPSKRCFVRNFHEFLNPTNRPTITSLSLNGDHIKTRMPCFRSNQKKYNQKTTKLYASSKDHDEIGGSNNEPSPATIEQAAAVGQSIIDRILEGNPSSLMAFLSDAVIDAALERKRTKINEISRNPDISFMELLELVPSTDFNIDSYAMRGIILSTPASCQSLSTLRISKTSCRQRYLLITKTGEHMILNLHLDEDDSLEAKYRSLRVIKQWFLKGITGEPDTQFHSEDSPSLFLAPSPHFGPESVVASQIDALHNGDIDTVFNFASPKNKEAFSNDIQNFKKMLTSDGYAPLLHHQHGEILKSTQITATNCFSVVGITAKGVDEDSPPQKFTYGWAVGLYDLGEGNEKCWLTDSVYFLSGGGFYVI